MRPEMVEPISDEELARLKKSIVNRWKDKSHFVNDDPPLGSWSDSPGCTMRAHEVLALVKRIEIAEAK